MLKIKLHNKGIQNYSGIWCIDVSNTTKYLKKIIEFEKNNNDNVFYIDGKEISINDFIIVDPLTKLEDLYNFSSKNILNKIIGEFDLNIDRIISQNHLKNIANQINKKIGVEFIDINQSPLKLFKSVYYLNSDNFLDKETLYKYLENNSGTEKQNILIKDFDDINLNELVKFTNYFNIIVISNNAFNLINSSEEVTLISFIGDNLYSMEIIESEKAFEYYVEDYFQKSIDLIEKTQIYNKEFMENIKKQLFLE